MRIALISQYYPPERGAVQYCHRLARALLRDGHELTVLAGIPHFPIGTPYPGFRNRPREIRVEDGITVVRLWLILGSNQQTAWRLAGFLTFAVSVFWQLVAMKRQDVIIASVPTAPAVIAAMIVSRLRRSKFVVLLKDIEPLRSLSQRGLANGVVGRAIIRLFMWVYRHSDRVVAVHPSEIELLTPFRLKRDQIEVISHGVASHAYLEAEHCPVSVRLDRNAGRILAVYVGTMGLVHGLIDLIESIADPRIQSLAVDFAIVGDGQFSGECRKLIQERRLTNIQLVPSIPPEQTVTVMSQADVLICSYRNQDNVPLGSKFYEYCASGKPILVHGRNLAGYMVSQIGNGAACDAGDVPALCQVLQDFVSRPDHWRKAGQLGKQYAGRFFSQSDRDRQWQRLVLKVAGFVPAGTASNGSSKKRGV